MNPAVPGGPSTAAAEAPWWQPLQPALGAVQAAVAAGQPVADALNARLPGRCTAPGDAAAAAADPPGPAPAHLQLAAGPLCFVPQAALPAGEAYEAFIHRTAGVPTRDNPHDLFNGLVWLALPMLKRRLNELQAAEIAQQGIGAVRGPLRDALTLFDENGALLTAPPPLADALRQRDWAALFHTHRPLWAQARLQIVGHALLAQLAAAPRKGLTAHVLVLDEPGADAVAQAVALTPAAWAAKPFSPLPVLGVPGWWPANTAPGFYDDAAVFRPPRGPQAGRKPSIDR